MKVLDKSATLTSANLQLLEKSNTKNVDGRSFPQLSPALETYLAEKLGRLDSHLLTATESQAWELAKRGRELEIAGKILAGRALTHLQKTLSHGEFSSGLEAAGYSSSSAYYTLEFFKLFSRLPDRASIEALESVGSTKAMSFKRWSDEDLISLTRGENVNGIDLKTASKISSAQLELLSRHALLKDAQIKKLASEKVHLQEQLTKTLGVVQLTTRLIAQEQLPAYVREMRGEALAITAQITASLSILEDTAQVCLFTEQDDPERFRWQPATARTVFHSLASPIARGVAFLRRLEGLFDGDNEVSVILDSLLTPGEVQQFLPLRDRLLDQGRDEKKERDDERANSQFGKRGRKRGTGNK